MGLGGFLQSGLAGASVGAAGGPWGALIGGGVGLLAQGGEELGWYDNPLSAGNAGAKGQGAIGSGIEPDRRAFQMSPEQQAFMQQLQGQATGQQMAPWTQAALDQIRSEQMGLAAGATSANRALAQREAAQNIAKTSQRARTEGQGLAQQMYMQMSNMQNQMNMAYEKLRSGAALSMTELQMMQNQEQMRQQMAMMQGVAAGIGRGFQGGSASSFGGGVGQGGTGPTEIKL